VTDRRPGTTGPVEAGGLLPSLRVRAVARPAAGATSPCTGAARHHAGRRPARGRGGVQSPCHRPARERAQPRALAARGALGPPRPTSSSPPRSASCSPTATRGEPRTSSSPSTCRR